MHSGSREEAMMISFLMPRRGWHILVVTLAATAALNALRAILNVLSSATGVISSPDFTIVADSNLEFMRMKARIGLALVLGAVALCFSRLKGLTVSCIALAWVMVEYNMWWYRSYVLAKSTEAAGFSSVSHLAYLHSATWWDVWIIAITVVLLAYQLKILLKR